MHFLHASACSTPREGGVRIELKGHGAAARRQVEAPHLVKHRAMRLLNHNVRVDLASAHPIFHAGRSAHDATTGPPRATSDLCSIVPVAAVIVRQLRSRQRRISLRVQLFHLAGHFARLAGGTRLLRGSNER